MSDFSLTLVLNDRRHSSLFGLYVGVAVGILLWAVLTLVVVYVLR